MLNEEATKIELDKFGKIEEAPAGLKSMELSDQALGAIMMALQKSLLEQSDIVPILKNMQFVNTEEGLCISNPPVVKFKYASEEE